MHRHLAASQPACLPWTCTATWQPASLPALDSMLRGNSGMAPLLACSAPLLT
jgi:hypothetical protein